MGLLVGLPLKLFHIVFVLVRLTWPLLLILAVVWFVRKRKNAATERSKQKKAAEPQFDGPVYTVDYREVKEEKRSDKEEEA